MDQTKLKRLSLAFEKRVTKNQELRIKFPDEPTKFLSSEVELHDSIQGKDSINITFTSIILDHPRGGVDKACLTVTIPSDLRTLATAPDLYPAFVDLQCVPSLLGLLSHENADISIAVVDLLQELTDIDTLNESEEGKIQHIHTLNERDCKMFIMPVLY